MALASCAGDDGEADASGDGQAEGEGETGEGETGEPPSALGDRCEDTLVLIEAPTSITASLRDASPDPAGIGASCGLTGPVVFAEVTVHGRADLIVSAVGREYTPSFAVLLPGCSGDPSRVLACGDALPVSLDDVGPELEVLVAVGVDAADPVLEAEPAQADPLDFELRLEVRPVLDELDRCGPAFGRCEAGTVCLAEDEGGLEVERCRRPPADSCVAPGSLVVPSPGAAAMRSIPSTEPHSDAHEHSCTGWRRPERVERLELPNELDESATLVITADDPRVGLALREPDCLPEHALACAPATGSGDATSLSVSGPKLAPLADAGEGPLLFIELPEFEPDPSASVLVSVEVIE